MDLAPLIWLGLAISLPAGAAPAQTIVEAGSDLVNLYLGEGKLIEMTSPISTVFLANPNVADVEVKSSRYVYVYGKGTGETTLFAIDDQEEIRLSTSVKVSVNEDAMNNALRAAVPNQNFRVRAVDGALVISGMVGTVADAQRIDSVVRGLAGEGATVVNGLELRTPPQVNLQVKIAEVSRSVTDELGVSWNASSANGGFTGGSRVANAFSLSGSAIRGSAELGVILDALKQEGLVTILSEPNLTARSGDTATFLAGGRFPYQTKARDDEVQVVFEPFGVELTFQPNVLQADQIMLEVTTQIRELDFSNGSATDVQTIPLILERSASTTIEVGSGQSFAIAGLFNASTQQDVQKLPGLGDLSVIRALPSVPAENRI